MFLGNASKDPELLLENVFCKDPLTELFDWFVTGTGIEGAGWTNKELELLLIEEPEVIVWDDLELFVDRRVNDKSLGVGIFETVWLGTEFVIKLLTGVEDKEVIDGTVVVVKVDVHDLSRDGGVDGGPDKKKIKIYLVERRKYLHIWFKAKIYRNLNFQWMKMKMRLQDRINDTIRSDIFIENWLIWHES